MKRESARLKWIVVGVILGIAGVAALWRSSPGQAALQGETPIVSLTPYPPVVEMAEGDPAVIILGAAVIVLIIIGGFLWERQKR